MLNKYIMSLMILLFFFQAITANNVNIENINIIVSQDSNPSTMSWLLQQIGIDYEQNTYLTLPSPVNKLSDIEKMRTIEISITLLQDDDYNNIFAFLWNYPCDDNIKENLRKVSNNYVGQTKKKLISDILFPRTHTIKSLNVMINYYSLHHNCKLVENSFISGYNEFTCRIYNGYNKKCYKLYEGNIGNNNDISDMIVIQQKNSHIYKLKVDITDPN